MNCIRCGTEFAATERFCGECGLARPSATAEPVPAPGATSSATRRELRQLVGHEEEVVKIAFSADGSRVVSADLDGAIHVWEVASGRSVARWQGPRHRSPVDLSPACTHALFGTSSGLQLVDLGTGQTRSDFGRLDSVITAVAFLPDGRSALVSTQDRVVRMIELASGLELRRFEGHREYAEFLVCAPNASRAASVTFDPDAVGDNVLTWDLRSDGPPLGQSIPLAYCVAFSPDGKLAVAGAGDGTVYLWETETRRQLRTCEAGGGLVLCVAFTSDGRSILTGGGTDDFDAATLAALDLPDGDHDLRMWDIGYAEETCRFSGALKNVSCIAVSPDGRLVAAGGADRIVHLWQLP